MSAFHALRHRDFSLYFTGQTVSMVGTWMQNLALGWLVLHMTGQAKWLGLVGFCAMLPAFLLSPLGGWAADHARLRRLVIVVQSLLLLQAAGMTWLAWSGRGGLPALIILAALLGVLTAFDVTARQVLVARTVPREDLPGAIALHSATFHGSRIVGPVLAGLVLTWSSDAQRGTFWCFLINAFSYLAALTALLFMRAGDEPPQSGSRDPRAMLEGGRILWNTPLLRRLVLFMGCVVLMGMPHTNLLPFFAEQVLRAGAKGLAWITFSSGIGATLAALLLARRKGAPGLERQLALAGAGLAVSLFLFGCSRNVVLSSVFIASLSFFLVYVNTGNQTLVQLGLPDAMRGRVMAIYGMVFIGAMPLAALWGGYAAQHLGGFWVMAIEGLGCAAAAALFAWGHRNGAAERTPA